MKKTTKRPLDPGYIYLPDTFTQNDIKRGKLKTWLTNEVNNALVGANRQPTITEKEKMIETLYKILKPEAESMAKERDFLLELRANMASDSWPEDKKWVLTDGFCSWEGIDWLSYSISNTSYSFKFKSRHIVGIDLSRHYLFGNEAVGRKGNIPESIGDLKKLRKLNLCYNFISGSIPSRIKELKSTLTEIRLEFNQLTGNLPSGFGELINLKKLAIDHNKFEGDINELAKLTNLTWLNIHDNFFTGKVPESMEGIKTLTHFWFYNNKFEVLGPKMKARVNNEKDWKEKL